MAPARRRCSLRERRAPNRIRRRRKFRPAQNASLSVAHIHQKKEKGKRGSTVFIISKQIFGSSNGHAARRVPRVSRQECCWPTQPGSRPKQRQMRTALLQYRIPVPLEYRLMFRHLFGKLFRPLPSLTAARALNELAPFEPCLGSHVLAPGTLILDAFYPSYHPPCSSQPLFGSAVDHTACSDCSSAPPVRRSRQALCRASAVAVSLHAASGRYFN